MKQKILWPYYIGSGNRPIPYLFQEIAGFSPDNFEITYLSVDGADVGHTPVNAHDYNTWRGRWKGVLTSFKKYDMIHTGGLPKAHLPFALAAKSRNYSISHLHTYRVDVDPDSEFDTGIRRRLGRMADRCSAVSKHTARTVKQNFGIDCEVIYNGVNTRTFNPTRKKSEILESIQYDKICGYVGSLIDRKRPKDIIKVARSLTDVKFLIIGSGELREEISEEVVEMDNVILQGEVPKKELPYIYPHLDSFIFPSIQEGCPNVVLESLASGTPVVGYHATSMPELIQNEKTGRLVKKGDIGRLTRALENTLSNNSMSKKARQYAVDNHSFEVIASQYFQLYTQLLS